MDENLFFERGSVDVCLWFLEGQTVAAVAIHADGYEWVQRGGTDMDLEAEAKAADESWGNPFVDARLVDRVRAVLPLAPEGTTREHWPLVEKVRAHLETSDRTYSRALVKQLLVRGRLGQAVATSFSFPSMARGQELIQVDEAWQRELDRLEAEAAAAADEDTRAANAAMAEERGRDPQVLLNTLEEPHRALVLDLATVTKHGSLVEAKRLRCISREVVDVRRRTSGAAG